MLAFCGTKTGMWHIKPNPSGIEINDAILQWNENAKKDSSSIDWIGRARVVPLVQFADEAWVINMRMNKDAHKAREAHLQAVRE